MQIDKKSNKPIYRQIEDIVKRNINSGTYAPGDKIPTDREWKKILQVNGRTITKALNNLVETGLLVRRQGSGTYVSETPTVSTFDRHVSSPGILPLYNPNQIVELKLCLLDYNTPQKKYWRKIIDLFNHQQHGVKITPEFIEKYDTIPERARKYDLFTIYDWECRDISSMLMAKFDHTIIDDLQKRITPELRKLLKAMEKQNFIPGVPFCEFAQMTIANKSLLPGKFIKQMNNGWTWNEFLESMIDLQVTFNKKKQGDINSAALRQIGFNLLIDNILTDIKNTNSTLKSKTKELEKTLTLLAEFNRVNKIGILFFRPLDYAEMFRQGKLALVMGVVSTLAADYIQPHYKNLHLGAIPALQHFKSMITASFMCISGFTPYPKRSEEFLRFIVSHDAQEIFAKGKFNIPIINSLACSEPFLSEPPQRMKNIIKNRNSGKYSYFREDTLKERVFFDTLTGELKTLLSGKSSPANASEKIISSF